MSKQHYTAAHEELIEEYLDAHPNADWTEAYEATADGAWERARDAYWDRVDYYRQLAKDGEL